MRLLPAADLSRGPFGLLNLGPTRCDDFAIVEALQRQLRALQVHPEARSPEAEAVRMDLYAAVAQLRDREARDALGRRYFREAWVPAPVADDPLRQSDPDQTRWVTDGSQPEPRLLPPEFPPSSDEFTLPDEQLQSGPRPVILPETGRRSYAAAGVLLIVGALAVVGIVAWLISVSSVPTVTPARPGAAARPSVSASASSATPSAEPTVALAPPASEPSPSDLVIAKLSPGEARSLLERLRSAADPKAGPAEFVAALEPFEQRWPEAPGDLYQPGALAIGERLQRISRPDPRPGVQALERIEAPLAALASEGKLVTADQVTGAVWAAGVLNRIKGDASIPARLISSARVRIASLTTDGEVPREHSFAGGALLALDALARRWARPDPATPEDQVRRRWTVWCRCAAALDGAEKGASLRAVAGAIDVLLRDGETATDAVNAEALSTVAGTVKDWRQPDAAERFLRWFDDPRVRSPALSVLTAWAAGQGPLAGVGASMILPTDATTVQRREMRSAYALRLGLSSGDKDPGADLIRRWAAAARRALSGDPQAEAKGDPLTALATAVCVARLNEAAARQWAMDASGAEETLRSAVPESVTAQGAGAPGGAPSRVDPVFLTSPGVPPDGEWARRYRAANNSESLKIVLLNQLRNGKGPEGPVDADVLAEAACYGSPRSARQLARQAVRDFGDRVTVVNAMLEAIADAPRQREIGELVRDLTGQTPPAPADPAWRAECRRALVEKLMSLTGDTEEDRADRLAEMLAECCRYSADSMQTQSAPGQSGAGVPTSAAGADAAPDAQDAARRLRDLWRDQARRIPEGSWVVEGFDELDRRHSVRRGLAEGPIQRFVGERLGAAEMMGFVVAGERSTRAQAVRDVLGDLAAHRRGAPTAFHQCLSAERAVLRLWLLRYGEGEQ